MLQEKKKVYSMAFFCALEAFWGLSVESPSKLFTWASSAHGLKDSFQKYKTHCYLGVSL